MSIIRWHRPELAVRATLDRLSSLRAELDRAFDAPRFNFTRATQFSNGWAPSVDIVQNQDTVTVRAHVAGVKKEDIEVTLHDGVLSIVGERKDETVREAGHTHRTERFFGKFQRSVTLPAPVQGDKIKASYKDGVLTVILPKTEEAKPKHIEVNVN